MTFTSCPAFNTHMVSYLNITTQRILRRNKQIGSSVKDRKKLQRVIKACSQFYACISSLLIKPELHSEIGSYRRESSFFWLMNQIKLSKAKNANSGSWAQLELTDVLPPWLAPLTLAPEDRSQNTQDEINCASITSGTHGRLGHHW